MTTGLISCAPEATLRTVAKLTAAHRVHAVYVFDSGAGAPLAGGGNAAKVEAFDTPTAAAHTYSLKAFCDAIGANQIPQVIAGAGGSGNQLPAYLRVTKA